MSGPTVEEAADDLYCALCAFSWAVADSLRLPTIVQYLAERLPR